MAVVPIVGYAAGALCTVAYLPQVIKAVRTRSVRDLSLLMLISLNAGLTLWVVYGFLIQSLPIILPNAVTLLLSAPLLVMKVAARKHESAQDAGLRAGAPVR